MSRPQVYLVRQNIREVGDVDVAAGLWTVTEADKARYHAYHQRDDQRRFLFGRIALRHGIRALGGPQDCLEALTTDDYGKPSMPYGIHFSIAHSGDWVVVALSKDAEVGLDIEEIRQVDFEDFRTVFTPGQWSEVEASAQPLQAFFRLWAQKEAVIKADGRGMSLDLQMLILNGNAIEVEGKRWFLTEIEQAGYSCYLATVSVDPVVDILR